MDPRRRGSIFSSSLSTDSRGIREEYFQITITSKRILTLKIVIASGSYRNIVSGYLGIRIPLHWKRLVNLNTLNVMNPETFMNPKTFALV